MFKRLCMVSVGVLGVCSISMLANAAEATTLSGAVLKLSEIANKPFTVNTGGLVVVMVHDSGSRPPQNVKVDAPRAYQPLGVVRGTQNEQGQALMGGGFTWYLFTPVTVGDTTIKASYRENGDGGKKVERVYKVKITKET